MATVEEKAEHEADKKGLTGEERKRYVGATLGKAHFWFTKVGKTQEEKKAEVERKQKEEAEKKRAQVEEREKRKAHPVAGYWLRGKSEASDELYRKQREAERKAKQEEQGKLIEQRTEEKRTREAQARLIEKYHNPNYNKERAEAFDTYAQLERDLQNARHNRTTYRKQSSEEGRIKKELKALDTKYGIEEEREHGRQQAQKEADEKRAKEEAERKEKEEAERKRREIEQENYHQHYNRIQKELKPKWRSMSEAELHELRKQYREKENDYTRQHVDRHSPEYTKHYKEYDALESVIAEKERPRKEAEANERYTAEYKAWLKGGKRGEKPKGEWWQDVRPLQRNASLAAKKEEQDERRAKTKGAKELAALKTKNPREYLNKLGEQRIDVRAAMGRRANDMKAVYSQLHGSRYLEPGQRTRLQKELDRLEEEQGVDRTRYAELGEEVDQLWGKV